MVIRIQKGTKQNICISLMLLIISFILLDQLSMSYYHKSVLPLGHFPVSTFLMIALCGWACLDILRFKVFNLSIFQIISLCFILWEILSTLINPNISSTSFVFVIVEIVIWYVIFYMTKFYSSSNFNFSVLKWPTYIMLMMMLVFYWKSYLQAGLSKYTAFNSVYFLLFLLPQALLLEKKFIKNLFLLIIFAAVITSYKRAAMVMIALAGAYYFIMSMASSKNIIRKIGMFFLIAISIYLLGIMFTFLQSEFDLDWTQRILNIKTDKGSGRFDIWRNILQNMQREDIYYWIAGHGYHAAWKFGGAHNDPLEIIYDFGVIGFILYILILLQLLKYSYGMWRNKYKYLIPYNVSLILFAGYSIAGQMIILPQSFLALAAFWGFVMTDYDKSIGYMKTHNLT